MARTKQALRAHVSLLWIAAALAAALSGCAVQSEVSDADVDEGTVEAASQLDQLDLDGLPTESGPKGVGAPTDSDEPDPEPWHPRQREADGPRGPDDIRAGGLSNSPGNHDKN